MKRKLVVLLAILAVMCWSGLASADTYTLLVGNTGGLGGQPTPFGTVTTTLLANGNLQVVFTASQNIGSPAVDYRFGHAQALDLNIDPVYFSGTNTLTITGNPWPTNTPNVGTPGSEADGFGRFDVSIDATDGPNDAVVSATLILDSTINFASAALATSVNGNAVNPVAAGMFEFTHGTNTVLNTGFASVPIPPSALLLGSGLLGLIGFGWRRRG